LIDDATPILNSEMLRFGRDLEAAAARAPRRVPRVALGRKRGFVVALAALVVSGGVAAGARLTASDPSPIHPLPAPTAGEPTHLHPVKGRSRIIATAPDPEHGRPFGLRLSHARNGMPCTGIGQIVGGKVGDFDYRGAFHPETRNADSCAPAPKRDQIRWQVEGHTPAFARGQVIPNGPTRKRELVVSGLAGNRVERIVIRARHFRQHVPLSGNVAGFIAVIPGPQSFRDIRLFAFFRDGSSQTFGPDLPRGPRLRVTPSAGTRSDTFAVAFQSPHVRDDPRDAYRVRLLVPRTSCTRGLRAGTTVAPAPATSHVVIRLAPASITSGARAWCRGRYKGFVEFDDVTKGITCSHQDLRGGLCARERPVGRFFTFLVR
jgi:hypothetical protein